MADEERKALPSRANRGNRMERLMAQEEEDDEADREFYQQDFWADAEGDAEFVHQSGESEESTSDSDISDEDADDDDDDDDDDDEVPAAAGSKRKGAYVDPSAKRAKGAGGKAAATKATAKPAATPRDPTATAAAAQAKAAGAAARRQERAAAAREGGGPAKTIQRGSLRASTIKASVEASEERLRQQAAAAKQPKQPGGARRKEFRRLTQDELLAEARQTEIINRASLEAMLRMEEAKRVVHAKSRAPAGPRVRTHSKAGRTTLTFIEMGSVPEAIRASAPVPPPPARCVITGLPAKYRDPQTGTPYATLDAFRTIRGRGRSRSQTYGPGAQAAL